MNLLKHFTYPATAALLLATAACTTDELADGTLNLGNQSQSLAYLLNGTGTANILTPSR